MGKINIKNIGGFLSKEGRKIGPLVNVNNRSTFVMAYEDKYASPRLCLIKKIAYRDCFGRTRHEYRVVEYQLLFIMEGLSIPFDTVVKKLILKYETERKRKRTYIKNHKNFFGG